MLAGAAVFAQGHKGFNQDRVAVCVERIPVKSQGCQLRRHTGSPRSQCGQCGLVEQGLDHVVEAVSLVRQPGIEDGAVREGQTLQQLAGEAAGVQAGIGGRVHHFQCIAAPGGLQ
jgi:hypothetical protein